MPLFGFRCFRQHLLVQSPARSLFDATAFGCHGSLFLLAVGARAALRRIGGQMLNLRPVCADPPFARFCVWLHRKPSVFNQWQIRDRAVPRINAVLWKSWPQPVKAGLPQNRLLN